MSGYIDFTWAEGRPPDALPSTSNRADRRRAVRAAARRGDGDHQPRQVALRGFTLGMRKRFADGYSSRRTTSSRRTRTTTPTSATRSPTAASTSFDLELDYGSSDRDIRHKFNFLRLRRAAVAASRATSASRRAARSRSRRLRASLNGVDLGRNTLRKDNKYFSFDWRLQRPFKLGKNARADPDHRDVQHLQQRQQHQPAVDARRCSTSTGSCAGRGRSAPGAARGEADVLASASEGPPGAPGALVFRLSSGRGGAGPRGETIVARPRRGRRWPSAFEQVSNCPP